MYRRRYTRKPEQPDETKSNVMDGKSAVSEVPLSPYMTVRELQDYLHVCRRTAYTLIHKEGFPAYKTGNSIRIDRKELEIWIHAHNAGLAA